MSPKITADHLARGAVVYVRQSTMTQVAGNTREPAAPVRSRRRRPCRRLRVGQTIDDDLGRSGSGLMDGPASSGWLPNVCAGSSAPCSASRRRGWRATGATGII